MGYIFDPVVLHQIAKDAISRDIPIEKRITLIVEKLSEKYPGHVNNDQVWVFNNAGGAMGAMYIIHASITEYVIIFGTPIGTEGHTGRFFADDYFIILEGEQWGFAEGQLHKEVYRPGELHHLPWGQAEAYKIPERCWALEYARGVIPTMLPFGVADTIFSTLDIHSLLKTFYIYGKNVTKELMQGKI
eukprot:Nk52_evm25s233 gene=Nk52_evmTU25s233